MCQTQSFIYFRCAQSQCALSLCMPCAAAYEQFCTIIIKIIITMLMIIIIITMTVMILIMHRYAS